MEKIKLSLANRALFSVLLIIFGIAFIILFNTFYRGEEAQAVQTGDGYDLFKEDLEVDKVIKSKSPVTLLEGIRIVDSNENALH